MAYIIKIEDKEFRVELEKENVGMVFNRAFNVLIDGKPMRAEAVGAVHEPPLHLSLIVENKIYDVVIENENTISIDNELFHVEVEDEILSRYYEMGAKREVEHAEEVAVRVPMPGLVIEVEVTENERVSAGQGLVIVEAMKMQNEMKAPRDGIVKRVAVKKGMAVNGGDTLVIIE